MGRLTLGVNITHMLKVDEILRITSVMFAFFELDLYCNQP